jgi:AraC-like DNA-binding protein
MKSVEELRIPGHAPRETEIASAAGFRLTEVRCTAGPEDRAYEEQHSHLCVALVKNGSFSYRTPRGSCVLRPGWLLLGTAGCEYLCSHENGRGDDCLAVAFSEETLDQIASAAGIPAVFDTFPPALPPIPRIVALMSLAERGAERSGGSTLGLEGLVFEIVTGVCNELRDPGSSAEPQPSPNRPRDASDRINSAVTFLENNLAAPLSLGDIAASVDLSRFHFLRLFRREVGVTPHQYLIRSRIRRAIELLLTTPHTVTEVAYASGFGDLSNFERTFRRSVGWSPGQFRSLRP